MDTQYRQMVGARTLVAIVDDNFDFMSCHYKIYRDGKLESEVVGYKSMLASMIRKGFEAEDIEEAVSVMMQFEHDTAHFGTFGSLIFTSDSLESAEGAAS